MPKCAYCGKEQTQNEMKQADLVYRTREWVSGRFGRMENKAVVKKRRNWYCKDDGCAGYDQMAHEG